MEEETEAGGANMLVSECGPTRTTRFLEPSKVGVSFEVCLSSTCRGVMLYEVDVNTHDRVADSTDSVISSVLFDL
jgi:hypothetical protein